ncbi:MAG: YigZ family protein [Clostridia bacterium]|nr:YigZ family protein [Oscillospiraceae bacterium]MBR3576853.1 YigZ family protein [Clostridia bacterium]
MNSMKPEYKTVEKEVRTKFTEKKSVFIATVRPVTTETEALEFVSEIKKEFSDATHNVYAYVLQENNLQRFTDDGEPSGTAGMPVLDAIRKRGLTDVAVVVTRYFGGTLLGTGGLVHAYGKSASEGITLAGPVTRKLCNIYEITADYNLSGKIRYFLETENIIIDKTDYFENVVFTVCIPQGGDDNFIKSLTEITCGDGKINKTDCRYVDVKEEE